MSSRLFERLARLERALAEEQIIYKVVPAPWLQKMSEEFERARTNSATDAPSPTPNSSAPPSPPEPELDEDEL